MNRKKILSLLLSLAMVASLAAPAMAAELPAGWTPADGARTAGSDVITILHTNDAHTYINNISKIGAEETEVLGLRYSTVAGYKASLENVLLVDAGDHVQGTVYGAEDRGETIIKLMAAAGYDVATLGNHEFDYTMDGTKNIVEWAKGSFPYVSCNFFYKDEPVLEPYKVFEVAGKKVAFVGITTPESITKSTPKYFMDEDGNYVYSIAGGTDGAALYAAVQTAIDAAAKEADYVIALGHMGVDDASKPWRSEDVIANTTGLTAFIDGHSHSEVEGKEVADKDGKTVILAQTGTALNNLGQLTITSDGKVTSELLSMEDLATVEPDAEVAKLESDFISMVDEKLEQPVGILEVTLNTNGPDGKRSIRKEETNLGNFCLDALMYEARKAGFEPDMAFVQGGGIRATLKEGKVSIKDLKLCYPWDGENTIKDVTGQELLDAMEWSYRTANVENTNEVGGFMQLSGMRVEVNLAIPSTVQQDENGVWSGAPTGEYRVRKIEIQNKTTGEWEPLDLNKTYQAVCGTYIFEEMGDGYNMFKSGAASTYVAPDYMSLVDYIQSFPVNPATGLPTIPVGAGYDEFVHTGRINYINRPLDLNEKEWWYDTATWALDAKIMKGTNKGFEATSNVTRASVLQTLYNREGNPAVETAALTDVEGKWWANAANWAAAQNLVTGTTFGDDGAILRGEVKTLLDTYCAVKGIDGSGLMKGNERGDMMENGALTRAEFAQIMRNLCAVSATFTGGVAELDDWGDVYTNIPMSQIETAGFARGDILRITVDDKTAEIPFCSTYSNVDNGKPLVLADPSDGLHLVLSYNMDNFSEQFDVKADSVITVALAEKEGYLEEYTIRNINSLRTKNRADYASDEIFANFRPVTMGGIGNGVLYRSSSPVDPKYGRNTYSDALIKRVGVKTVIDLADTEETYAAHEGVKDSYAITTNTVKLGISGDISSQENAAKLKTGLEYMLANKGPYMVHCTEGKDRAGFVIMVLECLMGGKLDEIVDDHMVSYENYFFVEKDSDTWNRLSEGTVYADLLKMTGVKDKADLANADLAKAAETYLTKTVGLTTSQVAALKNALSEEYVYIPTATGKIMTVEKYGHALLDIAIADFNSMGFTLGDIVTVSVGKYTGDMPYFDGYYTDVGEYLLRAYPSHTNIGVCISAGKFCETEGVGVGDTVTITLKEKAGDLTTQSINSLVYTNDPTDYASDEIFANFREVTVGSIGPGMLYRSCSPINNENNRAATADKLIKAVGVKTVMNLADSEEEIAEYVAAKDFASPYYKSLYDAGNVIVLNMSMAFTSDGFAEDIVKGLTFLSEHEGPYVFHCTEGKDRAGFAAIVLEALMGAKVEDIVTDSMQSYVNYYHIDPVADKEKYDLLAERNALTMLRTVVGAEKGADLAGIDLAAATEAYLISHGMTPEAISALKANLKG